MIKNDQQLYISKQKLEEFKNSLEELKKMGDNSIINVININAIKSQIETFEDEIKEYTDLKNKKPFILISNFENTPELLIKARIAIGLSQKELAEICGLKVQQIQRYESTNYRGANFERLHLIMSSLGIKFEDSRAILEKNSLKVEGFEDDIIEKATKKLHSRKCLLIN